MNRNRTVLAMLTLLTLACAGFAIAQTDTSGAVNADDASLAPGVQSVTGLVISFDNNKLVVRTNEGERTFNVASSTVHPATMQANLPVVVHFVTESGGDRAVSVEENSQHNAADQTPGGRVAGADQWPGAPNQDDNEVADDSMGTMDHSATGTMEMESDTTVTGSTGTTDSTMADQGVTGSTATSDTMADDSMAADSASSLANETETADDTMAADQTGTMDTETDTMASADQTGSMDDTLPATGSELPLVGLIGLAALAAAAGLHFGRNA